MRSQPTRDSGAGTHAGEPDPTGSAQQPIRRPIGLLWHDQPMKRFDRYVGFVSPPASFDITPQQFLSLCADPVGIVQHLSHYPGAA